MAAPRYVDFGRVYEVPPRLEDWLAPDHPARFIRAFVEALDLPALGFVDKTDVVGPVAPYPCDLLLRVWLYGVFERFRSTRRLEWACYHVVARRWRTGHQPPDHHTLWRFFRDPKAALGALFTQSVRVAAQMDLVGRVLHAVDGTQLQAACSTRTADHRVPLDAAWQRLDRVVARTLDGVHDDPAPTDRGLRLPATRADVHAQRDAVRAARAALDAAGTDPRHPGEPDARMRKGAAGRSGDALGYHAHATADAAHGIVVAADVVADASDTYPLVPAVAAVHATFGANAAQTVADAGYATPQQLDAVREQGRATVVVAGLEPAADAGAFDKARFAYDVDRDGSVGPRGDFLPLARRTTQNPGREVAVDRGTKAWCPEQAACTRDPQGRAVDRTAYDDAVDAPRAAQRTDDAAAARRWRKAVIELVFARAKWLEGFVRFTARGLAHARAPWALLCTTLNLRVLYAAWRAGRALSATT